MEICVLNYDEDWMTVTLTVSLQESETLSVSLLESETLSEIACAYGNVHVNGFVLLNCVFLKDFYQMTGSASARNYTVLVCIYICTCT